MISGASDEELELANARMDIMLATNYTPDNPGPLAIIDKYNDKEIDRLNNIISSLEKDLNEAYDALHRGELVNGRELINNIYQDIKALKEDNK